MGSVPISRRGISEFSCKWSQNMLDMTHTILAHAREIEQLGQVTEQVCYILTLRKMLGMGERENIPPIFANF